MHVHTISRLNNRNRYTAQLQQRHQQQQTKTTTTVATTLPPLKIDAAAQGLIQSTHSSTASENPAELKCIVLSAENATLRNPNTCGRSSSSAGVSADLSPSLEPSPALVDAVGVPLVRSRLRRQVSFSLARVGYVGSIRAWNFGGFLLGASITHAAS